MSRVPGLYGRTPPHPRDTHPRVMLDAHLDAAKLPKIPSTVERVSKVSQWPMYLNDQLGDCTCAAAGHQLQAWSAYGGSEITASDSAVLDLYEAVGGYVPGDPSTDQGANIQDILSYINQEGFDGYKISAFAELENFYNFNVLRAALYLFGSVYLGINCPDSAQQQFEEGQPWDYVPGAQIEGGHAIILQKVGPESPNSAFMDVITWGAVQPMTKSFAQHYVEEAWIAVSPEWMEKNGKDTDGFSLSNLMADFRQLEQRN